MTSEERYERAQRILHDMGLFGELAKIGVPHVIGSCRMNMMAWNDLDIDVENDDMTIDKLYALTAYIHKTFRPIWYEAKEEASDEGKTVWFHGFEAIVDGEKWNVDLWFFDRETIHKAEDYCDRIAWQAGKIPGARDAILRMKQELIACGQYGFYQYASMDVYRAVLEQGITDTDGLFTRYVKQENRI